MLYANIGLPLRLFIVPLLQEDLAARHMCSSVILLFRWAVDYSRVRVELPIGRRIVKTVLLIVSEQRLGCGAGQRNDRDLTHECTCRADAMLKRVRHCQRPPFIGRVTNRVGIKSQRRAHIAQTSNNQSRCLRRQAFG